jgi:hypothetical protein
VEVEVKVKAMVKEKVWNDRKVKVMEELLVGV